MFDFEKLDQFEEGLNTASALGVRASEASEHFQSNMKASRAIRANSERLRGRSDSNRDRDISK
ncbi:hypothetical protein [uncultured Litoreibacter sp.]|uniref:hypothetical protein n=1 Tax=uncultured Litoreibacter sp. TaxID=1392394 RepID=UPI0026018135|nr:hypothetical protein [uncultured Litoreibacter sp.]